MKELEMPTTCKHCHGIFDLDDMYPSNRLYPSESVCPDCHEKELDYVDTEAEIESLKLQLIYAHRDVDTLPKEIEELETKLKNIVNS